MDYVEILVPADPDLDDCLDGAAKKYVAEHPELSGYELEPCWADDDRDIVVLLVPAWHLTAEVVG